MKSTITRSCSLALLAGAALLSGPATAASPSQTECEANNGTFVKGPGGQCSCVYPEQQSKPGNMPDNYEGGALTTTQQTDSGQGNLSNKESSTTTCTGHKCPK